MSQSHTTDPLTAYNNNSNMTPRRQYKANNQLSLPQRGEGHRELHINTKTKHKKDRQWEQHKTIGNNNSKTQADLQPKINEKEGEIDDIPS